VEHIENLKDKTLNMHQWFGFLSFDVMGDFAFATSFNMLKTGKWDAGVKLVRDGMNILGPISPVPWLAQIGFQVIPGAAKSWKQMLAWCTRIMKERLAVRMSLSYKVEAFVLTLSFFQLDVNKPDVSFSRVVILHYFKLTRNRSRIG
jgi:hypothetical protein